MELHNLRPAKGSVKKRKRIARGQGSGHGGTSTRGHKGAKSRSGYKTKRNFEGGQMPLQMRLPKRGFKNANRVNYAAFNVSRVEKILEKYGMKEFTVEALVENHLLKKDEKVKILGTGEISKPVNFTVHAVSEAAKTKIEGQGGTVTIL